MPLGNLDYLDHLARESRRFAEAIDATQPTDRVPTCPDWDADDLLWHLGEVQFFWGYIARQQLQDPAGAEEAKPERPRDRAALRAWYDEVSAELGDVLTTTAPDTAVWTWADDHTIGFIRRRQAHEALIHRLDAELTAGARTEMDAALCADGVDEVLRVMYGGEPSWGTFTATDGHSVRLATTDTGHSWVARLGRFTGTSPDGDASYEDEPDMRIAETDDGGPVAGEVRGTAADLNCWLWNRPALGSIERSGDAEALAALDAAVGEGIS